MFFTAELHFTVLIFYVLYIFSCSCLFGGYWMLAVRRKPERIDELLAHNMECANLSMECFIFIHGITTESEKKIIL